MQALLETDSDGLLSGVCHVRSPGGWGGVRSVTRSAVVIDDRDLFCGIDGKLWEEKPDNRRVVGSE